MPTQTILAIASTAPVCSARSASRVQAFVGSARPELKASQQHVLFSDGDSWEGEITGYEPELLLRAAPDHYLDLRWEMIKPGSFRERVGELGLVELRRFDYLLTPAGDGRTRLTMVVQYALTCSVNRYAHVWIQAVIDDSEEHLLALFKRRAERRV